MARRAPARGGGSSLRARFSLLVLAMLLAAAAGGCVGRGSAGDEATAAAEAEATPPAATPPDEPASPPAAESPPEGTARTEARAQPEIVRKEASTRATAGIGFPCATGGSCSVGVDTTRAEFGAVAAVPVRATLTATWTATTPLAERLVVELFRESDGEYLLEAEGTSPLVAELDLDLLAEGATVGGIVAPVVGGVMLDQTVQLVLELEYA